jgi:hypothetical protein
LKSFLVGFAEMKPKLYCQARRRRKAKLRLEKKSLM